MPAAATTFRPVPLALIERIIKHARALGSAENPDAALAALFLLHCECKSALSVVEGHPVDFESVGRHAIIEGEESRAVEKAIGAMPEEV